jgi:hypothetical protein
MMTLSDAAGYVASAMVLLTFMTKDMRLLRALAIASNVAFVTYGLLVWLPPVFCLHLLLLPINALRLREMLATQSSRRRTRGSGPWRGVELAVIEPRQRPIRGAQAISKGFIEMRSRSHTPAIWRAIHPITIATRLR